MKPPPDQLRDGLRLVIAAVVGGLVAALAVQLLDPRAATSDDAGIDVTAFPPRGGDDAPRFIAAAARCPPGACVLRVPAGARLTLASPIVIAADRSLAILGAGHGLSRLDVAHAGVALTITQTSRCNATTVSGVRFQASVAAGAPIAGALAIDYSQATACAAPPQSVVLEDDEVLAAEDAHAMLRPYPGTFVNGIALLGGRAPDMIGLVRLNRVNVQPSLTAGPSLQGTSGLALGLIEDIEISNTSFQYAETAIRQTNYMEGLRLDAITAVGTDHFLTQRADMARQNNIFLQKMWLHDFEINTYRAAFPVALISNSFIGEGEMVRYADSGPDGWAGIDCTDCFGWMGAANLYFDGLVGNETGSVGIRFRSRERPSGSHSFIGTQFARLGHAVELEAGVVSSQFLFLQDQDAAGRSIAPYADRSGNTSNVISFGAAPPRSAGPP